MRDYIFFPYALPFLFLLFIMLFSIFFLFIFGVPLAFSKLGIPPLLAYSIIFLSIIGSTINIPVKEVESEYFHANEITFWGIKYHIPRIKKTVIAINFGGAIIPVIISLYEIFRILSQKNHILLAKIFIAITISSLLFHFIAKPVKGVGIAMPALIPPVISAFLGIFMGGNPAVIAYTSGTLGTLIGADLLNLKKIEEMGGIASIGGAGTFDGIFLTGIIALLLV